MSREVRRVRYEPTVRETCTSDDDCCHEGRRTNWWMCGCKGHGHEAGSLTTKGRSASGAVEADVPEVSAPEALLACMQGEYGGVGTALPLATFEGVLTFVYDMLLFSTLLVEDGVRDGLALLLNGRAVAVDTRVQRGLCDVPIEASGCFDIGEVGVGLGGEGHGQDIHVCK